MMYGFGLLTPLKTGDLMRIPLAQKRNGMYLFSRKDFNVIAELALQEYAPEQLEQAQPLDVEKFADEAYSLTILDRYLSASGNILGMINFSDIDVMIVNLERKIQREHLMSGTILVDARLLGDYSHRRRRFTIAHELFHWIIHRQMYYSDGLCCNLRLSKNYIACREIGSHQKGGNRAWDISDWMEWQADHFASSLLMPASTFYPTAREIMERHRVGSYMLEGCGGKVAGDVISELCDSFDVSRTAVCLRLKERNLLRSADVFPAQ